MKEKVDNRFRMIRSVHPLGINEFLFHQVKKLKFFRYQDLVFSVLK